MYAQDDHDLECNGERQYNLGAELCEINENKGCGITVACQYLRDASQYLNFHALVMSKKDLIDMA